MPAIAATVETTNNPISSPAGAAGPAAASIAAPPAVRTGSRNRANRSAPPSEAGSPR